MSILMITWQFYLYIEVINCEKTVRQLIILSVVIDFMSM